MNKGKGGLAVKGKKVIVGYIWECKVKWKDKFRWTNPHNPNSTPYIKIPTIFNRQAEKRLTWLNNKKVRITIEEIKE